MRVLKTDGSSSEIQEDDILYFSSYQNIIFVHTEVDEFIYPTSLSDLHSAFTEAGYERLDRSNLVNTLNVTGFDPDRKVVFFRDDPKRFAVVSEPNEKKARRIVESNQK